MTGRGLAIPTETTPVLGRIPPWLKQRALITLDSGSLRPGGLMLTRRAVDVCGFSPGHRILDVGCGSGMTLADLARSFGIRAAGCDPDPELLDRAAGRSGRSLVRSGLPRLPFVSGSWDGIFCECVLSLFRYRKDCLTELHRLLAPNGRLIITDLYIRQWPMASGDRDDCRPRTCLDGAIPLIRMLRALEETGFQIDMVEDHSALLSQLGTAGVFSGPRRRKTGYCLMVAGKY